jgi:DNA-formamidopyrimidine glycosylase
MPEGPEVKHSAKVLKSLINGAILTSIEFPKNVEKVLIIKNLELLKFPKLIQDVYSIGKRFIILLEDNIRIVLSFRMTGSFRMEEAKHTRAIFNYIINSEEKKFFFNDIRPFANAEIFMENSSFETWRRESLGWDPLNDEQISFKKWKSFFKKRKKKIGSVLQDQIPICGIGNYLRAEILYSSKISPIRISSDLNDEELKKLFYYTRRIMKKSFTQGGHTLSNYCDPLKNNGKFLPRVYGNLKVTRDCYCHPIVKIKMGSQTINYCPSVQI